MQYFGEQIGHYLRVVSTHLGRPAKWAILYNSCGMVDEAGPIQRFWRWDECGYGFTGITRICAAECKGWL